MSCRLIGTSQWRQERSCGPSRKDDIPCVDQRSAFGTGADFANRPLADIPKRVIWGMAFRWISSILLGLALWSCSNGSFFDRSRQYSGVWLYEFEGSTFVEGATGVPARRPAYEESDWLEWTDWPGLEDLMEKRLQSADCYTVQPFYVTFVGRRIRRPIGGAGHLGLWRSEIVVQRPISAKRLGPSFCYDR